MDNEATNQNETNLCDDCAMKLTCLYGKPKNICSFYVYDAKTVKLNDKVNHPSHYTQGGIECIDAIRASMAPREFQGYCKGNVIKYIWRYAFKGGVEDLKKARVYLNWMIGSAEREKDRVEV